ncbi:hypothetical protein [Deinococcus sp.]|uniref:hypothetical protein n=1 Tax=Deinococcus sp. TaxID=47478 RepID=UPI0025D41D8E|nr:hypothetical protein [Deinococcus sp.]
MRLLGDAYYEATRDTEGYWALVDALLSNQTPLPDHRALEKLSLWSMSLGLDKTDWARPLAARVVGSALYAPQHHHGNPVLWAAIHAAKYIQEKPKKLLEQQYSDGDFEEKDFKAVLTKTGFRLPVTGDFKPDEVADWLTWRLIECAKARRSGGHPPGWTALVHRLGEGTDRPDHKTMKKHTFALAEYAGIPITLLD